MSITDNSGNPKGLLGRMMLVSMDKEHLPIMTVYKVCDMALIDNFLLLRFGFFQFYYPETEQVMKNRKYGFNIRSQLLKLLVIFPAASALAAWIFSLF